MLKTLLADRILTDGPMPFEEFQRISLYHPQGFFGGQTLRSQKAGDFLTSPEVSPYFGQMLARFVDKELERILPFWGVAHPHLVEVAAGSGSLLRPLLLHLETEVEAWAVEASPAAREALGSILPGRVTDRLDAVPTPVNGVIIANELLDNIPVAIAMRAAEGWRERWVGLDGEELVLVDVPARGDVADWCDRFGLPCPDGGIVEVQIEAQQWVKDALSVLGRGSLVLVDYGDVTENLAPRRQDGTLRTYRSHHLGPHPLHEPGETDITVDVNFTAMLAVAEESGAAVELHRQDDFLVELGLREVLSELRQQELDAARAGETMRQMQLKSAKTEVETLLHPRGLGDFRVLVIRT